MSFVIIVGLVVAVIALLITLKSQSSTIKSYEVELTTKARKSRKNGANKKSAK